MLRRIQAGRKMRDRHPFLVLSPRGFNERTALVVGLLNQIVPLTRFVRRDYLFCR